MEEEPINVSDIMDSIRQLEMMAKDETREKSQIDRNIDKFYKVKIEKMMQGSMNPSYKVLFIVTVAWRREHGRYPQSCWRGNDNNAEERRNSEGY